MTEVVFSVSSEQGTAPPLPLFTGLPLEVFSETQALAARNKIRTTCGNTSTVGACITLMNWGKIASERGVATTL